MDPQLLLHRITKVTLADVRYAGYSLAALDRPVSVNSQREPTRSRQSADRATRTRPIPHSDAVTEGSTAASSKAYIPNTIILRKDSQLPG